MEADWSAEIGGGAAVIDAIWAGFVDLRIVPEGLDQVEEARKLPALRSALLRLNGVDLGGVWSSKCDLWATEDFDPDEMDADGVETARVGVACYIDLLPRDERVWAGPWAEFSEAELWARGLVCKLRGIRCGACRVDLVIREAVAKDREGFGVTAYLTGCGKDVEASRAALSAALSCFAECICGARVECRESARLGS